MAAYFGHFLGAANVSETHLRDQFVVFSKDHSGPCFIVQTIHISCSSDAFRGDKCKYGGIIIYGRDGQAEWRTANGTHCKSGYLVVMQTDTDEFKKLQKEWEDEPGIVHGIIYRKAFGESCKGIQVIGEGFGILNGKFTIDSCAFNMAHGDRYHDNQCTMSDISKRYVESVVNIWKREGPNFLKKQNYSMQELRD